MYVYIYICIHICIIQYTCIGICNLAEHTFWVDKICQRTLSESFINSFELNTI